MTTSSTNLDNVNRSSGDIFSIGEDINALEQYGITPEIYEKYKKMTDQQKEEQYIRVGLPHIKRRKLHFKSIELFPYCVIKYFLPIINKILSEENDDYGGLRNVLLKFQDIIFQKMKEHPVLGKRIDPSQFEFSPGDARYSDFIRYTFNIDESGNMGESSMRGSMAFDQTLVNDYIQEVNDYITNSLYKELFAYPKRMSRAQAEF